MPKCGMKQCVQREAES